MEGIEFHPMADLFRAMHLHQEHVQRGWNEGFALEYDRIAADIRDDGLCSAQNMVAVRWRRTHEALGVTLGPTPLILGIQSARLQFLKRHQEAQPRRW